MAHALVMPAPEAEVAGLFKLLGDETRLAIVRLLALTDLRGSEIVERLRVPHNAISYHLKQLSVLGLLRDRRSHADARDIYYSLDLDRLQTLYLQAGHALHPGLALETTTTGDTRLEGWHDRPLRVLFLCTHNSARSQLAEAILRRRGGNQVEVFSAGTQPTTVHPMASALLEQHGVDSSRHAAKSLDLFADRSFDYVITVCDRANDHCPGFPDDPVRIHWSCPDPALVDDDVARRKAFDTVWLELNTRIGHLLNLPHPATGRRLQFPRPTGQGHSADR